MTDPGVAGATEAVVRNQVPLAATVLIGCGRPLTTFTTVQVPPEAVVARNSIPRDAPNTDEPEQGIHVPASAEAVMGTGRWAGSPQPAGTDPAVPGGVGWVVVTVVVLGSVVGGVGRVVVGAPPDDARGGTVDEAVVGATA